MIYSHSVSTLSFENYPEWFACLSAEQRKTLTQKRLSPSDLTAEVARLQDEGRSARQYQINVLYQAFYWVSDEETQKTLRDNNLVGPQDDFGVVRSNQMQEDAAETNLSQELPAELADSLDDRIEELLDQDASVREFREFIEDCVSREVQKQMSEKIERIAAVFLSAPNVRISAAGLAFATQLDAINGFGSQIKYAAAIGVSRAAISKSVRHWRRLLDLPTNGYMKSEDACASYSRVQKERHWRRRKL